jgi:hypothetical protein
MKTKIARLAKVTRGGYRAVVASLLVSLLLVASAMPASAAGGPKRVPHLVHATELPVPAEFP